MKAKVIATGEIVELLACDYDYTCSKNVFKVVGCGDVYYEHELDFLNIDTPPKKIDWEQRRFELVKAAFCGLNANTDDEVMRMDKYTIATLCVEYADAVIAKLKEE